MNAEIRPRRLRLAGLLLIIGVLQLIVGINIAEALFPNYSVSSLTISELGAPTFLVSQPGVDVIMQPSSIIFVLSFFLFGLFLLVGVWLSRGALTPSKWLWRYVFLSSVGAIVVAASYMPFYGYANQAITGSSYADGPLAILAGTLVHVIGVLLLFEFTGLAALVWSRAVKKPLSYLTMLIGVIVIVGSIAQFSGLYFGLGRGGFERTFFYPALIWFLVFGTNLLSVSS